MQSVFVTNKVGLVGVLVCSVALCACGSSDASDSDSEQAPETFEQQVKAGGALYAENCASCHGSQGEGTDAAPRLVGLGQGALPLDPPASRKFRKTQFVTVADVGKFAAANMPPGQSGVLSLDQYVAILAFAVSANGIQLDDVLTLDAAEKLTIPRD
jgi:mono/diheme cytochrome c family protein